MEYLSLKRTYSLLLALFLLAVFIASCMIPNPTSPSKPSGNPITPGRSLVPKNIYYSSTGSPEEGFNTKDYPNQSFCQECGVTDMLVKVAFPKASGPNEILITENDPVIALPNNNVNVFDYSLNVLEYGQNSSGFTIATKVNFRFGLSRLEDLTPTEGPYTTFRTQYSFRTNDLILESEDGITFTPTNTNPRGFLKYEVNTWGLGCDSGDLQFLTESSNNPFEGTFIIDPYEGVAHVDLSILDGSITRASGFCGNYSIGTHAEGKIQGDFVLQFVPEGPAPTPLPVGNEGDSVCETIEFPNGDTREDCFTCPPGQNIKYVGGVPVGCEAFEQSPNAYQYQSGSDFQIQRIIDETLDAQNQCTFVKGQQ